MISKMNLTLLVLLCAVFELRRAQETAAASESSTASPGGAVDDNQCGAVLIANPSQLNEPYTLSYKYQRRYNQYESCIWTVYAPNRTTIKINITSTYFNGPTDYIAVGFFNKSNYDQLNFFTWVKLDSFSEPSIEVPGPVAFIHFISTNAYPGLGFRLQYSGGEKELKSIYNYDNYFIQGDSGAFRYPPSGGPYRNNQRTTIVVKASKGSFSSFNGQPYTSWINIKKVNLEDSLECHVDTLNIYAFGEGDNAWFKNKTYCGSSLPNHAWGFYHPRNDPIILTFKSDDNGVGDGFEFFWETFN